MPIAKKLNNDSLVKKPAKRIIKKKTVKNKAKEIKAELDISSKEDSKREVKNIKKAKSVIIDVISDDIEDKGEETFISDQSLAASQIAESSKNEVVADKNWDLQVEEIDRQKQFFSDLVSDMKKRKDSDGNLGLGVQTDNIISKAPKKSLSLYKQRAGFFLLLVIFWAAIVGYFSLVKLTIHITPQVEAMNDILFLRINGDAETDNQTTDVREQVDGSINELELFVNKTYEASGEEFLGEEIIGKVTIINNNNKDQSLIATTRLLSTDGKLFRLKDGVNVPAGSKVEVDIYADKLSPEMAISPSRFTIPGLWVGLQDKIYAESEEAFVYQQKAEKYIKASDIQLANNEAASLLLAKAKELKPLRDQDILLYQVVEPVDIKLSAEVGDKQENFTMEARAQVIVVSFDQDEVERLAQAKLNLLTPDDKELLQVQPDNMTYVLESYIAEEKTATIKASFSGLMVLKGNAEVIDKEKIKKLTADQIALYLQNFPEISEYELEFQPSFIKKAPYLVDRIDIKIKK